VYWSCSLIDAIVRHARINSTDHTAQTHHPSIHHTAELHLGEQTSDVQPLYVTCDLLFIEQKVQIKAVKAIFYFKYSNSITWICALTKEKC
jgi:hypothetical protein